jgi:hypothetical protein
MSLTIQEQYGKMPLGICELKSKNYIAVYYVILPNICCLPLPLKNYFFYAAVVGPQIYCMGIDFIGFYMRVFNF